MDGRVHYLTTPTMASWEGGRESMEEGETTQGVTTKWRKEGESVHKWQCWWGIFQLCIAVKTSLQDTETIVQMCNVLVWNLQLPPRLACSNSLRVAHPGVVIGLLCVDVVQHLECLKALDLCVCMCYCTNRCCGSKQQQKKTMAGRHGFTENHSHCWCTAIFRLFHELLTAKLFCVPHNKNNGDKCGKLKEGLSVRMGLWVYILHIDVLHSSCSWIF